MNIYELYRELSIDDKAVMARFMNNEALITRFVKKFADDMTFRSLKEAVEQDNDQEVERTAHTLKGVAANLGFDELSKSAADIVNAVRNKEMQKVPDLFTEVVTQYEEILKRIEHLD